MKKIYWIILFVVMLLQNCKKTDVAPEETGDIFKIDDVVFTLKTANFDSFVPVSCTGKAMGGFQSETQSTGGNTAVTAQLLVYNLSSFEGDISIERISSSNCRPQCFIVLKSSKGNAYMDPSNGTMINISKSKGTFSMRNVKFQDNTGVTFTVSIAGKVK